MGKTTKRHTRAAQGSLSNRLREVIKNRGLTSYGLAKDADLDPGVVARFVSGRRDIRLETADRLAAALGLKLVESGAKGRGMTRPTDAPAGDPESFAVNLSAGEVCDESGSSRTVPNPDPSPEGPGILSQNQ